MGEGFWLGGDWSCFFEAKPGRDDEVVGVEGDVGAADELPDAVAAAGLQEQVVKRVEEVRRECEVVNGGGCGFPVGDLFVWRMVEECVCEAVVIGLAEEECV